MLGFSLGKLLLLAVIVVIVWYGFKVLGRRSAPPRVDGGKDGGPVQGIDTVYDPETDTYVPTGGKASRKGRD